MFSILPKLTTEELLFKFIKFGVVGFSGVVVDFGITYLFKEKFKIQKYISNGFGFSCAASSNYLLNRVWTFHSINPHLALEFSVFFIVSIIGLGINSFVLYLFVTKGKKNFYLSKLFAIIVTMAWNFIANLLLTFNGLVVK
jgi:putative flippase GtrA